MLTVQWKHPNLTYVYMYIIQIYFFKQNVSDVYILFKMHYFDFAINNKTCNWCSFKEKVSLCVSVFFRACRERGEEIPYHPRLSEIPALDGSQDVMSQIEDYHFRQ